MVTIREFFSSMETGGYYYSLGLLMLLFLLIKGKKEWKNVFSYVLIVVLAINPIAAKILCKFTGKTQDYVSLGLVVPLLAFIAYSFTRISLLGEDEEEKGRERLAILLLTATAVFAGSLYPFSEIRSPFNTQKVSYTTQQALEMDYDGEERILVQIVQAAGEMEESGMKACLAAPKKIAECMRRSHPEIRLVYGRDMWQVGTAKYINDAYDGTVTMLYQAMEAEEYNPEEVILLAMTTDCNLIVLRQELSEDFAGQNGWTLLPYEQTGLWTYVRNY